jgi:hypothetical protein
MIDVDICMMLLVLIGLVLWGAYIRAQFVDWRQQQTANSNKKARVRQLYQVGSPVDRRERGSQYILS